MVVGERVDAPEFELDDKSQQGFISWFKALPQDENVIRIFDRKNYYSAHGENALFIARQFYRTTAVVKTLGSESSTAGTLPGVTFNRNLLEGMLRELLLQRGDRCVELYEGTGASWRIARSASPGKLSAFEEELYGRGEVAEVPAVMAITISYVEGQRQVGVGYVDASIRQLGACEFTDDEHLCALETVVVQLGAREAVIVKEGEAGLQGSDARRLRELLARCGLMASERPRASFSAKHLEGELGKLSKAGTAEQHRDVLERPAGCSALAGVLAFAEVLADSSAHRKWAVALYDPRRFMRLDAAAQRALNVMPTRLDANNTFSLYGLMSRGRTAMAKRRLKLWLKQPLVDPAEIGARHDVVEALVGDNELRERLRDQLLRGLPDVERLSRKLEAGKASLADLCQLYRASAKLPLLEEALRGHAGQHAELLAQRYAQPLAEAHDGEHLTKFEELLEAAIDLERIPEEYLICATYDPRLQELKGERQQVEARIAKLASDVASDLGLVLDKTIKLEWHKVANSRTRCLRITQKEEKAVRGKLARYITLETRKDGTKFTSKAMKEAAERLAGVAASYDELQRELVDQVVDVARTFCEVWETVASLLAELDVLAGFADLAACAPSSYVRPVMLGADEGEVVLRGCRHPCVEAQEGVEFIPNDCIMERGKSWFQIVTGPNMGGKSTFIRQVGAVVLMAQVGSFVPCSEARIAVRDCIFARVGAGDCQLRGVSTFMAEMLETAAILKGASERSLVIIDELGRGTSTYDGFGLAWAISEHLMQVIGAPTLFATHFHELTELQGPTGVANLHVETHIDPGSGRLTMLYNIKPGACDQSFGIHVAESAHFPAHVVQLAKRKLEELEGQEGGQGASKKTKERGQEEEVAHQRAQQLLKDFAAMPLTEMQPDQALKQLQQMYQQLEQEAKDNPALRILLADVAA